jgi:hypothetical protein
LDDIHDDTMAAVDHINELLRHLAVDVLGGHAEHPTAARLHTAATVDDAMVALERVRDTLAGGS